MVRKIATFGHHGRTVVACEPTTSLSEFIEDMERALTQAKEYGSNVHRFELQESCKDLKVVVKPEMTTRPQDAMKNYKRGYKHKGR